MRPLTCGGRNKNKSKKQNANANTNTSDDDYDDDNEIDEKNTRNSTAATATCMHTCMRSKIGPSHQCATPLFGVDAGIIVLLSFPKQL